MPGTWEKESLKTGVISEIRDRRHKKLETVSTMLNSYISENPDRVVRRLNMVIIIRKFPKDAFSRQAKIVWRPILEKTMYLMTYPSWHLTSIQCRLNVDATSWRCIDVEVTLYRRHVSAGVCLKRLRSACESTSSDQNLRPTHDEVSNLFLYTECPAESQSRLYECERLSKVYFHMLWFLFVRWE